MLKKILICALGILITAPFTGCPQAEAHPTDAEGEGKWTKRSGVRFGYVYSNNSHKPSQQEKEILFLDKRK